MGSQYHFTVTHCSNTGSQYHFTVTHCSNMGSPYHFTVTHCSNMGSQYHFIVTHCSNMGSQYHFIVSGPTWTTDSFTPAKKMYTCWVHFQEDRISACSLALTTQVGWSGNHAPGMYRISTPSEHQFSCHLIHLAVLLPFNSLTIRRQDMPVSYVMS